MWNLVRQLITSDSGATSIEYALIASGVAMAIVTVVKGLGSNLNVLFGKVQSAFQ
jgi:pilus assembly protein Flp/PilA